MVPLILLVILVLHCHEWQAMSPNALYLFLDSTELLTKIVYVRAVVDISTFSYNNSLELLNHVSYKLQRLLVPMPISSNT